MAKKKKSRDSSESVITIDSVSKLFTKQKQKTVKEFLPALFGGKQTKESFWALKKLSLDIKQGETVGIIGPNGSGKSTLLKLIAGVSEATEGSISIDGKIAPLIELGAGFHPDLTGRENVFLNGVILGMSRKEVEKKFKAIVNFAELWDFIDEPIKHYSSGMYLRLAFAVAIHTDPDILLVDEILAVGDENFQHKCLSFLKEFQRRQKTVVIVTHDLNVVAEYCSVALLLEFGIPKAVGSPQMVISKYQN